MAHRAAAARGTGRPGADPLRLPGAPVRDGRPVRPSGDRDRLPRKALLTRTDAGITVHTHLRMDGSWRVQPAAERASGGHRIRLILANDTWQAVGYLLGVVEILPTADEQRAVGHLGPDMLGPDWDQAEAERRLLADPARPIGEALLDQRNLAGIG